MLLMASSVAAMRDAREQQAGNKLIIKEAIVKSSTAAGSTETGCTDLNTYYFSASDVIVKAAGGAAGGGPARAGTTRLTVQLTERQLSPTMPVVKASLEGVVHNVAKTWTFLKVSSSSVGGCAAQVVRGQRGG